MYQVANLLRINGTKERKIEFQWNLDYKWRPSDYINIILVIDMNEKHIVGGILLGLGSIIGLKTYFTP